METIKASSPRGDIPAGKLTLFFSYARHAGTTRALLQAGRARKREGIDVVAGCIEPHTTQETLALLEGLPQLIPGGTAPPESLNLEAALCRKPQLLLIDGLSYNARGDCQSPERYEQILTLLRAGVNVAATLCVSSLEGAAGVTERILGEKPANPIPDAVFEIASHVQYVDADPEDILRRSGGQITAEALQSLSILRRLALRYLTHHLQLRSGDGPPRGHIIVRLSDSPGNAKTIQTAAKIARLLYAKLTALYIEAPGWRSPDAEATGQLYENLRLAERCGASIATVSGRNPMRQLAEYAQGCGATKVIMDGACGSATQLAALAPELDILLVADGTGKKRRAKRKKRMPPLRPRLRDIALCVGVMTACTLLCFPLSILGKDNVSVILTYMFGILIISTFTRKYSYSAAAALISLSTFNYFFTPPYFSIYSYDLEDPISFLLMFLSGLIACRLSKRSRQQARAAAQKAHQTEILLETSKKLQNADSEEALLRAAACQISSLLGRPVLFYAGAAASPRLAAACPETAEAPEQALSSIQWMLQNNISAGAGSTMQAGGLYLPVRNRERTLAVACILLEPGSVLPLFERGLISAMLTELASALEKRRLSEAKEQISREAEKERLRSTLLHAISHDLRTPLTSISGSANMLLEKFDKMEPATSRQLCTDIYEDSLWLIAIVENLLSATRLENGTIDLHVQPELLEDILTEAVAHMSRRLEKHRFHLDAGDSLLIVQADSRLLIQVVVNILDNAVKYTPEGGQIVLTARRNGPSVTVEAADTGPGISDTDKEKLFDMFYTAKKPTGDNRRGLGLGLFLCKSIIDIHGGSIYARDNQPRGCIIGFTVPAKEVLMNDENDNSGG